MRVVDVAKSVLATVQVSCVPHRNPMIRGWSDGTLRDDLTVEVIFFGEGNTSGNVTLNQEASAASPEMKAKL